MKTARQSFSICAMLLLPLVVHSIALGADKGPKGEYIAYIGYTNKPSEGIYAFRFDASTGKLTPLGLAAEDTSPSFLAVHPNHKFLYSIIEVNAFGGQKTGAISAFSIDLKTSKLKFLNTVSALGTGPCHVSVDKTGKDVLVANYDGSVAVSLSRHGCLLTEEARLVKTKFLRLRQPVELGHRIDGWRVCWLGGWDRQQIFYVVMVSRVKS
jgi:6-phosphogluconolactonase